MKKPIEIDFKFKQLKNFIVGLLKDLIVTIAIILLIYEFSPMIVNRFVPSDMCFTYLRDNNKLYVLCSPVGNPEELKGVRLTKAGTVRKEILFFLKPKANGVSNGIKRGTEIFTSSKGKIRSVESHEVVYGRNRHLCVARYSRKVLGTSCK